jgi:hypothetical protein
LNEQSGAFNDLADASRTLIGDKLGPWEPVTGSWARLRSGSLGVEWSQSVLEGADLRAGREVAPPRFDWAGLDYVFGPDFTGATYTITVGRAR